MGLGIWRAALDPRRACGLTLSGLLDDRISFTRTSAATYVNSAGNIVSAPAGTPRFDHDPVTLQPRGLLIEEQRTNLLTYSEDWTNAAWNKTNITVTAAATTAGWNRRRTKT